MCVLSTSQLSLCILPSPSLVGPRHLCVVSVFTITLGATMCAPSTIHLFSPLSPRRCRFLHRRQYRHLEPALAPSPWLSLSLAAPQVRGAQDPNTLDFAVAALSVAPGTDGVLADEWSTDRPSLRK